MYETKALIGKKMKKKITARRKEERKTRNSLKVLNRQEQDTRSATFCNFVEI